MQPVLRFQKFCVSNDLNDFFFFQDYYIIVLMSPRVVDVLLILTS